MWNLGKLQVFSAGSSSPNNPREHAVGSLSAGKIRRLAVNRLRFEVQ
jgi:hypothetical protein